MTDGSADAAPERDHDETQSHVTAFWATIAEGYEAHPGNVAECGTPEYERWVAALAATLPDPPASVLDVGCGSGYLALAAASLGHRVTAIDLAPAMLEVLQRNAAERSLALDARIGDAVEPAFPRASFDVLTNRHLLWTLRQPARAIANWRRVLRPGGRLLAVDGFWFTDWEDGEVPALFAEHYTEATRGDLPFMHLGDPAVILESLARAGFVDAAAEPRPELTLSGAVPWFITAQRA